MKLTYTAKRRWQRVGIFALILALAAILVWFCWVIWLERYVTYSSDGASLNFNPADPGAGQVAKPPSAEETIPIYINEGSDTINTSTALTPITGYYIDTDTLIDDLSGARDAVATLPAGTAVMVELKNIWGSFFYTSELPDATLSTKLDTHAVDSLITDITSRNLYAIAVVPAFRDRSYFLISNSHTSAGLPMSKKGYLWSDDQKCYWFNPTSAATQNWLAQIAVELKELGFDEVVFSEFRFPNTNNVKFSGDRTEAIVKAAANLVSTCSTDSFAVSFLSSDSSFVLPEGRSRLYLENVSAKNAAAIAATTQVADPTINLVFLATTNDTRFNDYSVIRPISTMNDGG